MLGIGLGAFMGGMEKGMGLRQQIDDRNRKNKEVEKADAQKAEREKITADTKAAFDASGQKPEQFEQFWRTYALPKMVNERLAAGDTEGAKGLQDWADTADAKAGAKLFGSALLKSQTGDPSGALNDAIKAAEIGGYMQHGMKVLGQDEIVDADGNVLGFRLSIQTADGKKVEQDVPVGQVGQLVSTFLNPAAAYESTVTTKAADAKDKKERAAKLQDHAAEKAIDAQFDTKSKPTRKDAVDALTKEYPADATMDEPGFLGKPADEQEKMVQDWLKLAGGAPGAPAAVDPNTGFLAEPAGAAAPVAPSQKLLVDTNTGKPVEAPGLSPKAAPTPASKAPGLGMSPSKPAAPQTYGGAPATPEQKVAIEKAASAIRNGANPNDVAKQLQALDVPPEVFNSLKLDVPTAGYGLGPGVGFVR